MANINKIKLSGTSYDIQDSNAARSVTLTQAEYDALQTKDPNVFYIISDSSIEYMTSADTESAITQAVSGKVDTSTYNAYTAATATAIGNKLAVSDFNSYSGAVDTIINSKASQSTVDTLNGVVTAHTANTTVHVTAQDKTTWNAKSDFSGNYNDLTNKPTIPTVPTSNTAFTNDAGYITIDAISGKVDTSTYNTYTAATDARIAEDEEVTAAGLNTLNESLSGKQDTLIAGDNITISGNVISAQGGSSYTAGRGISIANNTISFSLPISAGTGTNSIKEGYGDTTASGNFSHAEGSGTIASGNYTHAECYNTKANGIYSHAEGNNTKASGNSSHAEGYYTEAKNECEHASGKFNVSRTGATEADKTLFSVGNGTGVNARHNAFEIKQNGDIYLSSGGTDIKLQDHLGGGTVDQTIISGSTNAVAGGAVYNKFDEVEQVTAAALNNINDRLSEDEEVTAAGLNALNESLNWKADTTAFTAHTADTTIHVTTAQTAAWDAKQNALTIDSTVTSGSTNPVQGGAVYTQLGGLKLQKLTQAQYNALATKDSNTLYVIVN